MITDTLLPYVGAFLLGVVLTYCVGDYFHTKELNSQQKTLLAQAKKESRANAKVLGDYTTNLDTLRNAYITLGKQLNGTKISLDKCNITNAGRVLWDNSKSATGSVSTDTKQPAESRVSEDTQGNAASGIDLTDLYHNQQVNDEICWRNIKKLEAIKQWQLEQYGE